MKTVIKGFPARGTDRQKAMHWSIYWHWLRYWCICTSYFVATFSICQIRPSHPLPNSVCIKNHSNVITIRYHPHLESNHVITNNSNNQHAIYQWKITMVMENDSNLHKSI